MPPIAVGFGEYPKRGNMTLVERIQKYLIESNEYESWEQFVDSRSLGECQDIVDDVTREFPKAKKGLWGNYVRH